MNRRQKEMEAKLIEEETAKRVEEIVAQRVAEELEKRKDDIEAEVMRRVEEAKQLMEEQMLKEMERRKQEELEAQNRKEVGLFSDLSFRIVCLHWRSGGSSLLFIIHPSLDSDELIMIEFRSYIFFLEERVSSHPTIFKFSSNIVLCTCYLILALKAKTKFFF